MPAQLKRLYSLNNALKTFLLFSAGLAISPANPKITISLSDIHFQVVEKGDSDHRFIWIHGDEKTAKMALDYHLKHFPGRAFFILSNEREVLVSSTRVDPNRIFSRAGAELALRKFKLDWFNRELKTALDKMDSDREKFLDELFPKSGGLLIALHNNFRGYNFKKELPETRLQSIKTGQNPRDFIICTNESDYHKLEDGPFNVLLQDQLPVKDNGSLSWAALRKSVRYVNIETRLGWLSQQKKMLKFVEETLK